MRRRLLLAALVLAAACTTREGAPPPRSGETVQLTFIHTSDWHSRLLPYDLQLAATDRRLVQRYAPLSPILKPGQPLVQIGGVTRIATLIKRERERTPGHVVWVDSGDCFQGAPIFNAFNGEVEIRALSFLGPDAVVIGNHEFDKGLDNLAMQLDRWATYPVLAANYLWDRDVKGAETMARITRPYAIVNAGGVKIGVIGMANLSSLNSIGEGTNSMGVTPLDEVQTVQFYIDQLAGTVDLIGLTSHLGLTGHGGERIEDYEVIEGTASVEGTTGLDFVFGGHLHVVLDPPQVRYDRTGRPVVLVHSGAFMKYLGRLDVVVQDSGDPYYGYEIKSHRYELFPIDEEVPEDVDTLRFMESYVLELNRRFDLKRIIAYAPRLVPRFGREKAGSELGNIAAESMADRRGIQADFALTNTLGIRTDIIQGPITEDQMFNVFPFDNFVTKMFMSGREICEMMTFVARRSAGRGCQPQAQFSDRVHVRLNCVVDNPECSFASEVAVRNQETWRTCIDGGGSEQACDVASREPIDALRIYEVAVNDYIAAGGSGFRMLKFNNAKIPSDISIRDAVSDRFQTFASCRDVCVSGCGAAADPAACEKRIDEGAIAGNGCEALTNCFGDVSRYHDRFCVGFGERDPRDWCDIVERVPASGDPVLQSWLWPMQQCCGRVRAGSLPECQTEDLTQTLPPGDPRRLEAWCCRDKGVEWPTSATPGVPTAEPIPDFCPQVKRVVAEAAFSGMSLDEWAELARLGSEQVGIPAPSDRCACRAQALQRTDAQCRELACVVGKADDRLETALFETYVGAREALGDQMGADLCVAQALSAGCDLADIEGIGSDEEPN